MKKTSSIFLAVLLTLCLSLTAFAAPPDGSVTDPYVGGNDYGDTAFNGSIILTKLDINKFEREKLSELQQIDPDITSVTYTGNSPSGASLAGTDVIGSYQAYKGATPDGGPVDVTKSEMTGAMANIPFEIVQVQLSAGKTPGSTNVADYEPLTGALVNSTNGNAITDQSGIISWTGLPKGYYKVTELANSSGTVVDGPSYIVSLPMVDPADASVETNVVYMYPKNRASDGPTIEKDPPTSVNGNVFKWTVQAEVPATLKGTQGNQSYVITDTMANGLEYAGNLSVFYKDNGTNVNLTASTTANPANGDYTATATLGGSSLTVTLDENGYQKLAAAIASGSFDQSGGKYILYVTYDTVVNLSQEEFENLPKNPQNEVELNFTNSDGNSYTDKEDPIILSEIAGVSVLKFDAADKNILLPNAEFHIFTATTTDGSGNMIGDPASILKDGQGNAIVLKTDATGKASYVGLHTAGNYYLQEVTAPSGYKNLTGVIEVVITNAHLTANTIVNKEVANYRDNGFTLPSTGGRGTILFMAAGLSLILAAGLLFVISSKRKKSSQR